jgi:transposase InsO family protein
VKSEAFKKFNVFKRMIENHGRMIKILRTNRRKEFMSKEFITFCKQSGIQRQLITSYSPHHDDVAKRKNRTSWKKQGAWQ